MFVDGAKLADICDRLALLAEDPAENREQLATMLSDFFEASGFKVLEVADALGITDQTIYRWLRRDGKPKPTYMRRLKLLVAEKLEGDPSPPPRSIRVGIPPFWDSAILTAFVQGFAAHNIEPEFVPVPATHGDVHRAFRSGKIDVAVHNHFLVQYDHALKKKNQPDFLGLSIRYPFYVFGGYYIYVRRGHVQNVIANLNAAHKTCDPLNKLMTSEYDWSILTSDERLEGIKDVLRGAYVGVERWTGMELAMWSAYSKVHLNFEEDAYVNLRNDTANNLYASISGLFGGDPQLSTYQAMVAFEEGIVDVFCGGLAQHRYLQQHSGGKNSRADDTMRLEKSQRDYLVLMGPSDVQVSAYFGLVAPPSVDEELIQTVASIWQGCIRMFLKWNRDIIDPDRKRSSLATSQLAAMLRTVESYVPEDLRLLSPDLTTTSRWKRWSSELPPELKRDALTKQVVEFYQQDWRNSVREWMDLMTTHCHFLGTPGEARAVFAKRHNEYGQEWGDRLYNRMERMAEDLVKSRFLRTSEPPVARPSLKAEKNEW